MGEDRRQGYYVTQCQVLSAKGDVTGGLKAFKNTIEAAPADTCLAAYLWCAPYLSLIGAKDVAENAVVERLESDEDKERFQACKRVVELKQLVDTPKRDIKLILMLLVMFLIALCLFIGGWWSISSSTSKKKSYPSLPPDFDDK